MNEQNIDYFSHQEDDKYIREQISESHLLYCQSQDIKTSRKLRETIEQNIIYMLSDYDTHMSFYTFDLKLKKQVCVTVRIFQDSGFLQLVEFLVTIDEQTTLYYDARTIDFDLLSESYRQVQKEIDEMTKDSE